MDYDNSTDYLIEEMAGLIKKGIGAFIFKNALILIIILIFVIIFIPYIFFILMLDSSAENLSSGMDISALYLTDPAFNVKAFKELSEDKQDKIIKEAYESKDYENLINRAYYDPVNVLNDIDNVIYALDPYDEGISNLNKDNWKVILNKVIDDENSHAKTQIDQYNYYKHSLTYDYNTYELSEDENLPEGDIIRASSYDPNTKKTTYEVITPKDEEILDGPNDAINVSCLNEPLYRASWEEVYCVANYAAEVDDASFSSWEDELTDEKRALNKKNVSAKTRLSEKQIKEVIDSMTFKMIYNFYDVSNGNKYLNEDFDLSLMEDYAYIEEFEGENVEHGTERYGETNEFTYIHKKIPTNAPAYAFNSYMLVEYDYDSGGMLTGRQVTIDGNAFKKTICEIFNIDEDDFYMDMYCEWVKTLPGSDYDYKSGSVITDKDECNLNSITGKINILLTSCETGVPYTFYDTDFLNCNKVKLGKNCPQHHYGEVITDDTVLPFDFSYLLNNPNYYDPALIASDEAVLQIAAKFLGNPYVWGGTNPQSGADCSGYVQYCYRQLGINLPRTADAQAKSSQTALFFDKNEIRPGDVFYRFEGSVAKHTGLIVGVNPDGSIQVIEARGKDYGICTRSINMGSNYAFGHVLSGP